MSKNSFFNRSRCFFPKASAKVRTFCGLAKYLSNFFASNTLFLRLDDCGQRGTPFIYLRARKKEQKTINKGERGRGKGGGEKGGKEGRGREEGRKDAGGRKGRGTARPNLAAQTNAGGREKGTNAGKEGRKEEMGAWMEVEMKKSKCKNKS